MRHSTTPRNALIALAASAALVLSGCAPDTGGTQPDSSAPESRTTVQQDDAAPAPSPAPSAANHDGRDDDDDCEWDHDDQEWDDCDDDRDDDDDDDRDDDRDDDD
ncbi:MAG: hypothetical protein ACK4UY_15330 [Dietzia sp.]